MRKWSAWCFILLLGAVPALAQQTGSISGSVKMEDGTVLPGVLVEAASSGLPQARTTSTDDNGEYRLPLLPPGPYEITFSMSGMATVKKSATVLLQQTSTVNANMAPGTLEESINVVAEAATIDPASAELKAGMDEDVIQAVPLGQEYRDLVKLIPGVQFTQDGTRGPSAGGSGQDNAYQFDGVNVTLPLFGTLSSEPSSHDIEHVSVVKGGAKAVDFNRSGGFTINSESKSGTSSYHGLLSYQVQSESMTNDRKSASSSIFEEDQEWLTASLGGPILKDRLFFYLSAYSPNVTRQNRANSYGPVPDFESNRDEYFGKLTFQPAASILLHGSYRTSDRDAQTENVGALAAASVAASSEASQDIAIAEGSWVLNSKSYAYFKFTDYALETTGAPDTIFGFRPALDGSVRLDVANLDKQGAFTVPTPIAGQTAFNDFIAPLIQRYGFLNAAGQRAGGGVVGGASLIDANDFYRQAFQIGYDRTIGRNDLHLGVQRSLDEEDLDRTSNGWGSITVVGGRTSVSGVPIAYTANLLQTGLVNTSGVAIPIIHSEFESTAIEINDTLRIGNWAFNLGLLASNDVFYGQGLREKSGTVSGFALARGNKYKMYEIDFADMIQPRLGAVWSYDGANTVYANFARYMPAASSLPRAASWERNIAGAINVDFDATGRILRVAPEAGSSGKVFDDGLDPRTVDEYMLGTSRQLSSNLVARAHARYRYGYNFWEDTDNNDRVVGNPPSGIPRTPYVPNLADIRREIGGSSYVIAELDGAFTKYWEVGLEGDWRGDKSYVRGSYVWSHYYGNFDQDNSTTANDANVFVGSSFIADFIGRQVWDRRYGDLRGDRRHQLKVYGFYDLPWNATVGTFAIYQSGQPWEVWDVEAYRATLTAAGSSSTSSASRFAEAAGSRTTDAHYQIDLNYTQNIAVGGPFEVQVRADVFNVFDRQTGYNIQNQCRGWVSSPANCPADFGKPRNFYDPRRLQLALKVMF
jgi:hypothetical protein